MKITYNIILAYVRPEIHTIFQKQSVFVQNMSLIFLKTQGKNVAKSALIITSVQTN